MLNIRRNVIFSLIEVCTNTLLMFISYRVLVRLGGIPLLGVWSSLMAWIGLSRLGDFGLGSAATRFVAPLDPARELDRVRGYVDTAIISNLALITALSITSGVVVWHWLDRIVGPGSAAQAAEALPWMVAAVVCNNLCLATVSALAALHRGFIRSIVMVCGNLLQLCLVLWLVPALGLKGFAIAQVIQFSLAAGAAWAAICHTYGRFVLPARIRWQTLREMLNVSVMLQMANIANSLFEPVSKILVGHFGGMHMLGLYEASYKVVTTARNVTSSMASATVPAMARFVQTDMAMARDLYRKTERHLMRGLLAIFAALVAASPVISLLFFRSVERQFIAFVAMLAVGSFVGGWCTPAYNLGQATGRLSGVIIAMSANVAMVLVGGLVFGLAGMPALIVAAASLSVVFSNLLVRRLNEPLIGLGRAAHGR